MDGLTWLVWDATHFLNGVVDRSPHVLTLERVLILQTSMVSTADVE